MECPICKNEEFEIWETGTALVNRGAVSLLPLMGNTVLVANHEREIMSIFCKRCGVLIYHYECTPPWRDYTGSLLYWDEEKQCLDSRDRIIIHRTKPKDILETIPRNILLDAVREVMKQREEGS